MLGITAAGNRVAVLLAESRTVPDIAAVSGRAESSIRTDRKGIYDELGLSRQADLIRLVLSVTARGVVIDPEPFAANRIAFSSASGAATRSSAARGPTTSCCRPVRRAPKSPTTLASATA